MVDKITKSATGAKKQEVIEHKGGCSSPWKETRIFNENGTIKERQVDKFMDGTVDFAEKYDANGNYIGKSLFEYDLQQNESAELKTEHGRCHETQVVETKYDANGKFLSKSGKVIDPDHYHPLMRPEAEHLYTYNQKGQKIQQVDKEFYHSGGIEIYTANYEYDDLGRLIKRNDNSINISNETASDKITYSYYNDSEKIKSKNKEFKGNSVYINSTKNYIGKESIQYDKKGRIIVREFEQDFTGGSDDLDKHTLETYKFNSSDLPIEECKYNISKSDTILKSKDEYEYNIFSKVKKKTHTE